MNYIFRKRCRATSFESLAPLEGASLSEGEAKGLGKERGETLREFSEFNRKFKKLAFYTQAMSSTNRTCQNFLSLYLPLVSVPR